MSEDYVPLKKKSNNNGDDFPSMGMNLLGQINIKIAFFIFLFGFLIFSDIFIKNILNKFSGAVNGTDNATTKGTIIQLLFLVIAYIIIDLLVKNKYI
jgi:hypothetical protein